MLSNQLAMMFVLIVTLTVLTTVHGTGSDLDPSRPNVCPYETYESGYVSTNTTYGCYQTEEISGPCPFGFWSYPVYHRGRRYHRRSHHGTGRHFWKRQIGMCFRSYATSCSRLVVTCEPRVVIKYYCCNGTEPNGIGGCGASTSIECCVGNGNCEHMCVTTDVRGHHCACRDGYKLDGDTKCVDINECATNDGGCDQFCVNTPGSFHCTCRPGYTLKTPLTCTEKNDCLVGNGGCEQNCTSTNQSYYCSCRDGFVLKGRHQCEDDDECSDPIVQNGGCSHTCTNEYGEYYCSCPAGYSLDERGFNCLTDAELPVMGQEELPLKQAMVRPVVLGPIIGALVFLILLVLIAICCFRRRRAAPAAVAGVPFFFVGKKIDLEKAVEAGDEKATMRTRANLYTTQPQTTKKHPDDPPTYEDIIEQEESSKQQQFGGEENPSAYENVDFRKSTGYEKPKVLTTPEPNTYANAGFDDSEISDCDKKY